ncbi:GNAT family N-acetyltransferase [Flavobacterium hercynium]|uniref:GNAT family N-acetyltransferase n=1 Tax=Flavobacterium hercynium TaxID=387094 RepID=A0A226HH35_9FLAO|nr:GNAT family N-acetyltransferase [Flavobacterium hercynium]OXA93485.1 GNAT family N-acetyltransferase [Flavobacterium hercynium]SMP31946.1 Acetyltransferase (GNAT) family protein [Flavobacterium hercynium]
MNLKIDVLRKDHEKKHFSCGKIALDDYFHKQAGQDARKDLSVCYVVTDTDEDENKILGYYTLTNNSIPWAEFPEELTKKIPKSYSIPTALLGRLAVDKNNQGRKLGEILLFDALKKCLEVSEKMGLYAVIVDPLDDAAIAFYQSYGFILIPSNKKMFITIKTIEDSFSK